MACLCGLLTRENENQKPRALKPKSFGLTQNISKLSSFPGSPTHSSSPNGENRALLGFETFRYMAILSLMGSRNEDLSDLHMCYGNLASGQGANVTARAQRSFSKNSPSHKVIPLSKLLWGSRKWVWGGRERITPSPWFRYWGRLYMLSESQLVFHYMHGRKRERLRAPSVNNTLSYIYASGEWCFRTPEDVHILSKQNKVQVCWNG